MCIPQEAYHGTGTIECGKIGRYEIHFTIGVKVNVKTDEIDGMARFLLTLVIRTR